LFDRLGRRLVLNQAGEQLLLHIRQPLAALEQAAIAVKDLGRWGQGRLRFGAPASVCQHLLPEVLRELHDAFPKLMIRAEAADNEHLLEQLGNHQIDLAIALEPAHAPGLETELLFEDELLFAFSAEHPWAGARSLPARDIERQPLLLLTPTHATRRLLEAFFAAQDIKPTIAMEIGSVELLKQLVQRGVGVGVLAPWILESDLAQRTIRVCALGPRPLKRRWTLLYSAERRLSWPEEKLISLLRARLARTSLLRKDLPRGPGDTPLEENCVSLATVTA